MQLKKLSLELLEASMYLADTDYNDAVLTSGGRRVIARVNKLANIVDIDASLYKKNSATRENALDTLVRIGCAELTALLLKNARVHINRRLDGKTLIRRALVAEMHRSHGAGPTQVLDALLAQENLLVDDDTIAHIFKEAKKDFLQLFVRSGKVDPRTWRSKSGKTLLHLAMDCRPSELSQPPVQWWADMLDTLGLVISYVRSHGLDPNAEDAAGNTALHYAAAGRNPNLMAIQKFTTELAR